MFHYFHQGDNHKKPSVDPEFLRMDLLKRDSDEWNWRVVVERQREAEADYIALSRETQESDNWGVMCLAKNPITHGWNTSMSDVTICDHVRGNQPYVDKIDF